jgi:hypothetical protein
MLCHSSKLKTTVLITSFFFTGTVFAQEPEGDVAPAPVELEEEPEATPEPEPAPAPVEAAPEAAPAVETTVAVPLGTTTEASASTSSGAAVVLGGEDSGPASSGGVDVGTGGWGFGFHGYFRAPFRMGIATRDPSQRTGLGSIIAPQADPAGDPRTPLVGNPIIPPPGSRKSVLNPDGTYNSYVARDYDPAEAYKKTTIHVPQIPDDQYLTWQHTNHNSTDWSELFFSVGNSIAEGTVSVEGYNFTQTSYTDPETQFGVAQGYATIKPELPWDNVRIIAKVGAHWGRYGMAGRYDAGEYDTYLFGRTKVMGALVREQLQVGKIRLAFEEGFGGHKPHPSKYNTAKFTLLGHGHAFLEYKGTMVGLHYLHAWAQEEDRDGQGCPGPGGVSDATGYPSTNSTCTQVWGAPYGGGVGPVYPVGSVSGYGEFGDGADGNVWLPDGSMDIMGPELKIETGTFGLFYFGYSMIKAKNALTVGPAVEVLHSNGGGEFGLGVTNNFLDNPQCNAAKGECSSGGNGTVHNLSFQYEFSYMNLKKGLESGERFWGEGRDFIWKLYGLLSMVKSDYDVFLDGSLGTKEPYGGIGHPQAWALGSTGRGDPGVRSQYWSALGDNYSEHSMLKFGTDFYGSLFSTMAVGLRMDRVMPNNHLPNQAFNIITPRLEFRSRWVTRERIMLSYSRYMYAQRECPTLRDYNSYEPLQDSNGGEYPFSGSPQNWGGLPATQDCVQIPSGPKLPEGYGATALEATTNWRGAPIAGGNPNSTRPDENVIKIEASMWW